MKKSDLKTGMWIETEEGKKAIVLLGTKNGDILSGENKWCPLSSYDENLCYMGLILSSQSANIVKIYQPNGNSDYWNNGGGKKSGTTLIWDKKDEEKEKMITSVKAKIEKAQQELINAQNELDNLEREREK